MPLLCLAACTAGEDTDSGGVQGLLLNPQMSEISGIAASRRHPGVLWMHDDGGNPARLFATTEGGRRLATFTVDGVTKTDWEDMAAFRLDGKDYLLIADTGDNGGLRRSLQLHVFEEPDTLENARLVPAWSVAFRWPDGPMDCEAVAVDAAGGRVLLISKKRVPPELFSLPLRHYGDGLQVASRIGALASVPAPAAGSGDEEAASRTRLEHQVTAADLSPDGRQLAVMTYRDLLVYTRVGEEDWGRATARAPATALLPWLPQAEALAWQADGRQLLATGEHPGTPLYRLPVPASPPPRPTNE
ncbi:hypothetical protein H4F99_02455 [Lysobacter sp. SG-8]|uniref:Integral membrane protein n=1 Tax=Marilutibacter penaei TaxID=2759900 RepID=A0A7W3YDS5_9GAMM|nr:hypothetical protein [Lysobacter penaei]MBB1087347.1 hypothetical protein [Lysobacter penaei]